MFKQNATSPQNFWHNTILTEMENLILEKMIVVCSMDATHIIYDSVNFTDDGVLGDSSYKSKWIPAEYCGTIKMMLILGFDILLIPTSIKICHVWLMIYDGRHSVCSYNDVWAYGAGAVFSQPDMVNLGAHGYYIK